MESSYPRSNKNEIKLEICRKYYFVENTRGLALEHYDYSAENNDVLVFKEGLFAGILPPPHLHYEHLLQRSLITKHEMSDTGCFFRNAPHPKETGS